MLDMCLDQVHFMGEMLDIQGRKDRIAAALTFAEQTLHTGVRSEALRPLHYLFAAETELGRADFKAMSGLGDRVATETVAALLREGYLATDSSYGRLRFAFPPQAPRFYLPALWPEAEEDASARAAQRRIAHRPARKRPSRRGG